jgi:hypothetical protein
MLQFEVRQPEMIVINRIVRIALECLLECRHRVRVESLAIVGPA